MLSLDYIRENKDKVIESAKNKGYELPSSLIDDVLKLDNRRRELIQKTQSLNEERNKLAKEKVDESVKTRGRELKEELKKLEQELKKVEEDLKVKVYEIPAIPADDVRIGKDESENEVVRKNGEPTKFSFKVKDHVELGEILDVIDFKRAVKVSGNRFGVLKNEGALLEFALIQLALEVLVKEGFTPVVTPTLIKKEITDGLGYWNGEGAKDYYVARDSESDEEYYLVGTAEHAIVPLHKDESFNKNDLPKRYAGFSSAFRSEAGSYGKDVRGVFRVHQFDKVEMVSFVAEEDEDKEHEFLLSLEEKLFQLLEIPYQVVKMVTGDLGFPAARKIDIEAWIPSQEKYREVTSVSTTADFQSRRLNIKYADGKDKKYARILNGTAFSIFRPIIALLENHQQEDGSVKIPKALQKYTGFSEIKPK